MDRLSDKLARFGFFIHLWIVILIPVVGGCSLTGSWKPISIDPPDANFTIEYITFDKNHQYTATWLDGDQIRTSVGIYHNDRFSLDITNRDDILQFCRLKKLPGRRLMLIYETETEKVSTILVRDKP